MRELFAVGLLAGFYIVTMTLLAFDMALAVVVVGGVVTHPTKVGHLVVTMVGCIASASALLYGLATASCTAGPPPDPVLLRRAHAPGLWRLVDDLAGQLRTRPPSRIYLTREANASVSEDVRLLGLVSGKRSLHLGAPLLLWLKPMELRAVLCHELGHYAGRHTRFGAIVYRGAASLRSTLFRLRMTARSDEERSGITLMFQGAIGAYAWVYLRLSLAVRRRQELEADAEAAAVIGPEMTAQALRAAHALGVTWTEFESRYLRPAQRLGFVPEDVFEAFAAMVDDPLVRERMAELRAHPVEAGRSPLDSHPPLARRLALIEARPAKHPATAVEEGPLVTDPVPLALVQGRMLGEAEHSATALPRTAWAARVAEASAIEPARLLLEAASDTLKTARPTLATVLDLLERGEQPELIRRLADAPEPEKRLIEGLHALIGQTLATAGRARWVLSWTQGCILDCPQDSRGRLDGLVAAAARDRGAVSALRGELARLGANVEAPATRVVPAAQSTARRSTRSAPDLVVTELSRQRKVANVAGCVMIAVGALYVGSRFAHGITEHPEPRPGPSTASYRQYTSWPDNSDPLSEPGLDLGSSEPGLGLGTYEPGLGLGLLEPTIPQGMVPHPPPDSRVHNVVPGDTLSDIACMNGTTVEDLQELNDTGSKTSIAAGQMLLVPAQGRGSRPEASDCR
ncbi:M48 family metalloprotease [Streptomyces longispororuber]|uniref:M48 family metalloprotease n=1 Tax=Streptomyces longispororuber TaxID=68230 RepID=UPI0036F9B820